jgi:uncharacterized membrane-anchored protein
MEFDATIRRSSDQRVHVTASDDVRFFWLFGVPYVVTSPVGKSPGDLATLDEAARAGIVTVTVI